MRVIAVPTELVRIRAALKAEQPHLKASQLSEGFARGLGFGSHAAFLAWDRDRARAEVPVRAIDLDATLTRILDLGGWLLMPSLEGALARCGAAADHSDFATLEVEEDERFQIHLGAALLTRHGWDVKAGITGHIGMLLSHRLAGGYCVMDFVERFCEGEHEHLHLRLAAAFAASESLDPEISRFLVDCLLEANRSRWIENIPDWRDAVCYQYAPRIRAFVLSMMMRGPLGPNPFLGPVPRTAKGTRRRQGGEVQITLSGTDTGRTPLTPEALLAEGLMGLWQAGVSEAVIEELFEKAGKDLRALLERRFGIPRNAEYATIMLDPHPFDGYVATTPGRAQILVATEEQAKAIVRRAPTIPGHKRVRRIVGPNACDKLEDVFTPWGVCDLVHVVAHSSEPNADETAGHPTFDDDEHELLNAIVNTAGDLVDVVVTGLIPDEIRALADSASAAGIRIAIDPAANVIEAEEPSAPTA